MTMAEMTREQAEAWFRALEAEDAGRRFVDEEIGAPKDGVVRRDFEVFEIWFWQWRRYPGWTLNQECFTANPASWFPAFYDLIRPRVVKSFPRTA